MVDKELDIDVIRSGMKVRKERLEEILHAGPTTSTPNRNSFGNGTVSIPSAPKSTPVADKFVDDSDVIVDTINGVAEDDEEDFPF